MNRPPIAVLLSVFMSWPTIVLADTTVNGAVAGETVAVEGPNNALQLDVGTQKEPLATDRPDFTESTSIVPRNMIQIESGYTFSRQGTQHEHTIGEVLVRGSINEKTEWRAALNSYVITRDPSAVSTSGKDDISLGFKRVLSPGSGKIGLKGPAISLIGQTSVPTGSRTYRSKWQTGFKFLLSWDLTEKTALSSNLNYTRADDGQQRFHEFAASLSLGHSLSERLGTFLEVYGFFRGSTNQANSKYVNGGFTYLVNNDLQFDLRLGTGLGTGIGPDYFVGAGISHRF